MRKNVFVQPFVWETGRPFLCVSETIVEANSSQLLGEGGGGGGGGGAIKRPDTQF